MKKSSKKKKLKMVRTPSDCANTSNEIDRISQLSDDILYYILSFMTTVDVMRLSVLSRRWKSLWKTIPYLKFDVDCFEPQHNLSEIVTRVINWVLLCQGSNQLTRFCLQGEHKLDLMDIMMWVRVAALRNVKELQLRLSYSAYAEFELPDCLVTCESLRFLKLNMQYGVLKLPNSSKFKQLTSLYLELVEFSDDDLTRRLFSHCIFLEELSLIEFLAGDMKVLDISSSSLKRLTLTTFGETYTNVNQCELKISCPKLFSITYRGGVFRSYCLDDISSLDTICIDIFDDNCTGEEVGRRVCKFLEQLEDIRVLRIVNEVMRFLWVAIEDLQCFSTTFRRLKSLHLSVSHDGRCTQAMYLLLNHCPNLESLTLVNGFHFCYNEDADEDTDEDTEQDEHWQLPDEANANWGHHLKSVWLHDFRGLDHELSFVKFMLRTGIVLEKCVIVWWEYCSQRSEAINKKVLEFPKASPLVKVKVI